ncbi:lytic transglycosylase domain-containing protein [Altererythrobacter sp. RZ02]|uniref:Lytic transglycosylase domain-containing protein n=2 Tax=Pontixanthobacter rizhaonensis TaxID=2730337 RepID=A0A848QNC1_9SPHN|nr:lytic transglycosylase domain-containing protein [Pontixanthobacter rizhaonensis]NMW32117.1 lytic transglycosylase domain-containing protein [Pontixanthobacter rizhaonensis]
MILRLAGCALLTFGIAVPGMTMMSAHARADVLEIGADGAQWIAGGTALPPVVQYAGPTSGPTSTLAPATELSASFFVPPEAVADAALLTGLIPEQYLAKVHELAARFDLSPALIEALVWQESRWRANAISPAGARGLAQLMPGTAKELGVDPDDPFANLEGGARYLRQQLDRFDGNLEKALAAYNAGPGRVIRAGGIPNIRETKKYVAAIMGRLSNHSRSNLARSTQ